jgi:hypothetical protein
MQQNLPELPPRERSEVPIGYRLAIVTVSGRGNGSPRLHPWGVASLSAPCDSEGDGYE